MNVAEALIGVERLFLDTAPLIYLIERHPRYIRVVGEIFQQINQGTILAVTSPVTLAETLVVPYRMASPALYRRYDEQVVRGRNTSFVTIDARIARQAADLRARYDLRLADALQAAVAVRAGCDVLLTNDTVFRRIAEIRVLLVDDLQL